MNIYIAYDRYERDEWYSIYHIETNRLRAIKHFKDVDLVDFISYGPDDCHSFQLQKVVMTSEQYRELLDVYKNGSDEDIKDFMMPIYDENDEFDVETIFFTDGCSDNFELIEFYCRRIGIEADDYDAIEEAEEKLFNDEELYLKILKDYIKCNYWSR